MRIPSSTYRLQLSQLGFRAAQGLIGYLDDLGVTDCYCSPLLAAREGSTHGYDIIDHERIDPQLGTEADFVTFATALQERGMGLLLDIVPNHMSIAGSGNRWWMDVLENGPSSAFARFFDIDWDPPKADLKAKVLLPILGDQFGRVLERGEISIRYEADTFVATYFETRLPIAPRTWVYLLEPMIAELRSVFGDHDQRVEELESILTSLEHLPLRTETNRTRVRERQREKEIAKRRLAMLINTDSRVRTALDHSLAAINGVVGVPSSVDRLEALLAEQGYRPTFWRVAADEINYRRFFDINELAAIRVEEPSVLRAVHSIPLRLFKRGLVTGLRIDHVDGLLSPQHYLTELGRAFGRDCYLVVEKILDVNERLPRSWPVHGTTGYEVTALLTRVLVSPSGLAAVEELYQAFTGNRVLFPDVIYESKQLVLRSSMSAELTVLARKLDDISEQHRASRDFTLIGLQEALRELVACFPVYRTYIDPETGEVEADDRAHIATAIAEARRRNAATSASIFEFLRSLLMQEHPDGLDAVQLAARRDFVLRFQQLTSPVMAKGLEDTAFYRHFPVLALNEVGSGSGYQAITVEGFHRECVRRAADSRLGLSATATHDTKRGEDARARLCVISERPTLWRSALLKLSELARPHKPRHAVPDANEEYLLYQTLIGAWPADLVTPDVTFVSRIQQYMNKALKEAKVHSSWINPDDRHDEEVRGFIARLLDPAISTAFLEELARVRGILAHAGYFNSLSQVVLKIGMPGVPDFYQGTELWDFSLVDPDNRRPVDFAQRRQLLETLRRESEADPAHHVERLLADLSDGRIKMFVTMRALQFRRMRRALFEHGTHVPLAVSGEHSERVIAFARSHDDHAAIVVCGRHFTAIAEAPMAPIGSCWGSSVLDLGALAGKRFRDAITGRTIEVSPDRTLALREVFSHLPVAILEVRP